MEAQSSGLKRSAFGVLSNISSTVHAVFISEFAACKAFNGQSYSDSKIQNWVYMDQVPTLGCDYRAVERNMHGMNEPYVLLVEEQRTNAPALLPCLGRLIHSKGALV
eukprot:1159067-Pelagomonas_calceolata.AAC.12